MYLSTCPLYLHTPTFHCTILVSNCCLVLFVSCTSVVEAHASFSPQKGVYLHFKARCSFHKISRVQNEIHKINKTPTWSNRRSRVLSPAFKLIVSLVWISYLLCQHSEIHGHQVINSIFEFSMWCLTEATARTLTCTVASVDSNDYHRLVLVTKNSCSYTQIVSSCMGYIQ